MSELQPLLDLLGAKHGWVAAAVAWVGALRVALKPFGAGVARFVASAIKFCRIAGPGEVSWLDRWMHSVPYRLLAFLVDYLASVKLPLHAGEDSAPKVPPVALVAVLAGAGLVVGCATLQQVATPERVRAVAALAGYTSCVNDTRGRPIERGKWVQVVGGLKVMVDANQWDGVTVAQALERAGISEVVCEEGQVAIAGGLAFLDMFTGVLQRAESAPIVRAVAEGMLDGIGRALDQSAGSRRNDLADLMTRAQATRPRRRRAGRAKTLALVGLLACVGCASVKMESTSVKFDPKTGIVSTNTAIAKVTALGGSKAIVDSLSSSAGVTSRVGAKGVDAEASMQWVVDLVKLAVEAAKTAK